MLEPSPILQCHEHSLIIRTEHILNAFELLLLRLFQVLLLAGSQLPLLLLHDADLVLQIFSSLFDQLGFDSVLVPGCLQLLA